MQSLKGFVTTSADVKRATVPIGRNANKYTRGRVLILASSEEWRGAMEMAACAAYNALAALRTGAGFVTVAAPKNVLDLAGTISPVFVLKRIKNTADLSSLKSIRHDVMVVGPGIQEKDMPVVTFRKIQHLEQKAGNIIVVDAGPLYLFGKAKIAGKELILTPHDGEFKKMTGIDPKGKTLSYRLNAAKKFARSHGCTLVLKGNTTIITDGMRVKLNISKTSALATMGTGDVLAGMISAFAAQNGKAFESAVAAVYLHSKIGDALFKKKGMHIIATDVIDAIPEVLKKFDKIV